ncbi:MAG: dockerin type I repeat-containing protein [Dehalococcoidales bacterium]|nr:dockerin type I repeat-containing protein [Dehalococcoidales bacterium]
MIIHQRNRLRTLSIFLFIILGLATVFSGTVPVAAEGSTDARLETITVLPVESSVYDSISISPSERVVTHVSGRHETVGFMVTAQSDSKVPAIIITADNWTSSNAAVATVDSLGTATITGPGTTTITVWYSGLTANATLTVLLDTIPPDIDILTPYEGQTFGGSVAVVSCRADDTCTTPEVTVNDEEPVEMSQISEGYFSYSVYLSPGLNTIFVTGSDPANNRASTETISVISDPNRRYIDPESPADGLVTGNHTIYVTGTLTDLSSAVVRVNGMPAATVTGTFSVPVIFAEGENTVTLTGYTPGMPETPEYLSSSGIRRVFLDTTPPEVTVIKPVKQSTTSYPGLTVDVFVDELELTGLVMTINGENEHHLEDLADYSDEPGYYRVSYLADKASPMLNEGINTITFAATDRAGNTGIETVNVYYAPNDPEVKLTSPQNRHYTNNATLEVKGIIDVTGEVYPQLYVNDDWVPGPFSLTVSDSDGFSVFSQNITLSPGINTVQLSAGMIVYQTFSLDPPPSSYYKVVNSGEYMVVLEEKPPVLEIGITDPVYSTTVTVTSDEPLAGPPVIYSAGETVLFRTAPNIWEGILSEVPPDNLAVTAVGTDRAGNIAQVSAEFYRLNNTMVPVSTLMPVQVGPVKLSFNAKTAKQCPYCSLTSYTINPVPNSRVGKEAGLFAEFTVCGDYTGNIDTMEMCIQYNEADISSRGLDESGLRLWYLNSLTGGWQPVPDSTVNLTGNYVTGTLDSPGKFGVFSTIETGDADGNGTIDVLDVTAIVRTILLLQPEIPQMDANGDGTINVFDITATIRKILGLD